MKKIAATFGAVAGVLCMTVATVNAGVYSETKSAQAAFAGVISAELPARAVSFISHKIASQQADAAVGAMKAAIAVNPSSTASVLASIVSALPSAAAEVTAAAVQAMPKQRLDLAKIAAKSAPAYAAKIAARLAKQDPQSAKLVGEAIAEVVPNSAQSIMLAATTPQTSRIPDSSVAVSPVNKALDGVSQGGPYVPGGTVPLVAALTKENANSGRTYAAP